MKSSTLNLVTTLKGKLLEFPAIVSSLEKKEITFLEKLFLWIKKTEEILLNHSITEVSELSGLRSKILNPKFSDHRTMSSRTHQLKIASEVLYDLQHTVLKVVTPIEQKVEECRELIRQLLQLVSQTQVIKYNRDVPFDMLISDIWQFIRSNEQLKGGVIKLKTHLIMNDIYILIADEINLEDF